MSPLNSPFCRQPIRSPNRSPIRMPLRSRERPPRLAGCGSGRCSIAGRQDGRASGRKTRATSFSIDMPTAKEKFLSTNVRADHEKWAKSEIGEKATDYAMLAFFDRVVQTNAGDANALLAGARLYREILLDLGSPEPERKPKALATD